MTDPQPGVWVVWENCTWKDPVYGTVTLPIGFRTDLASTPQFVRSSPQFDPTGVSRLPAAFHDGAYARLWGWTKDKADQFLRDSLIVSGATPELAQMYYQAVNLFGADSWKSDEGALETRDFDTPAHYAAWASTQTQPLKVSP
jgi:Protein of unknown function (DUF1353)